MPYRAVLRCSESVPGCLVETSGGNRPRQVRLQEGKVDGEAVGPQDHLELSEGDPRRLHERACGWGEDGQRAPQGTARYTM